MKKVFRFFSVISIFTVAAVFISCDDTAEKEEMKLDKGVLNIEIPEWTKNEDSGAMNIPALILDGHASNFNETIKAEVKKTPANIDAKNIIFMLFDGLTDELIKSTEAKYKNVSNGELLLNDLPVKMTLKSDKIYENKDKANVLANYINDTLFMTSGAYVSTGSIFNPVFRWFKDVANPTDSDTLLAYTMMCQAPRQKFMIAIDNEEGNAKSESGALNQFYKAHFKFVENFKDALACYDNDEIEFTGQGAGHPTEYGTAAGLYLVYPFNATEHPSPVQSMAYALAFMETKPGVNGNYVLFHDDASGADKENELKNFDEAVVAASKYVLENPDTVLIVTSAALDGSDVPAYVLGNIPDSAKSAASLLDFVKKTFSAE